MIYHQATSILSVLFFSSSQLVSFWKKYTILWKTVLMVYFLIRAKPTEGSCILYRYLNSMARIESAEFKQQFSKFCPFFRPPSRQCCFSAGAENSMIYIVLSWWSRRTTSDLFAWICLTVGKRVVPINYTPFISHSGLNLPRSVRQRWCPRLSHTSALSDNRALVMLRRASGYRPKLHICRASRQQMHYSLGRPVASPAADIRDLHTHDRTSVDECVEYTILVSHMNPSVSDFSPADHKNAKVSLLVKPRSSIFFYKRPHALAYPCEAAERCYILQL